MPVLRCSACWKTWKRGVTTQCWLSRGRMKDQGIILDAFRDSDTLIITPEHTYNLSDDLDDEMAEFKTFMSRREYKIINKRLRRGLKQTIQDGCYVANAPYGYRKVTVDRKPWRSTSRRPSLSA